MRSPVLIREIRAIRGNEASGSDVNSRAIRGDSCECGE